MPEPESLSEKELHKRMEALEQRLAACRTELERMSDESRMDIGAALESLSEALERHEESEDK